MSAVRRSDFKRAVAHIESVGKKVAAVDFWPNGRFRLLTAEDLAAAESADEASEGWADLAGETEIPRA